MFVCTTQVPSLGLTHAEMQRDNDDVFAAVVDLVKAISVLVHTPHATLSEECITRVQVLLSWSWLYYKGFTFATLLLCSRLK